LVGSGASVDFQNYDGATPAIWCSLNGHSEILQYLLERSANAELSTNDGWRPLHYASLCNKPACVTVLLRHGVALDAITTTGKTALWWASYRGHLPIVQLLVRAGADIEIADNEGQTPTDIARECSRAEVVRYLATESKWRRRRCAFAMVFCSIKNVDSDSRMMRVLQNRDTAALIASYL
jgi:ankyrin repeat protein